GSLVKRAEEGQRLVHRELLGQLGLLELDAEVFAEGTATRLVGPLHSQPFEDLDGGGFPGAIGPQESEAFTAMDGEIETRDRRDVVVLLDESRGADGW